MQKEKAFLEDSNESRSLLNYRWLKHYTKHRLLWPIRNIFSAPLTFLQLLLQYIIAMKLFLQESLSLEQGQRHKLWSLAGIEDPKFLLPVLCSASIDQNLADLPWPWLDTVAVWLCSWYHSRNCVSSCFILSLIQSIRKLPLFDLSSFVFSTAYSLRIEWNTGKNSSQKK